MTASHPELDPIVQRLNERGIEATIDWAQYKHMQMIGIRTADDFFPLWEITATQNKPLVDSLDLRAIKERRGHGWTPFGFRETPGRLWPERRNRDASGHG